MEINQIAKSELFTDPTLLMDYINNEKVSEAEKVHVVSRAFEATLTEQLLKDSLSDMTKDFGSMIPELMAEYLNKGEEGPLGISHVLQLELQKDE